MLRLIFLDTVFNIWIFEIEAKYIKIPSTYPSRPHTETALPGYTQILTQLQQVLGKMDLLRIINNIFGSTRTIHNSKHTHLLSSLIAHLPGSITSSLCSYWKWIQQYKYNRLPVHVFFRRLVHSQRSIRVAIEN